MPFSLDVNPDPSKWTADERLFVEWRKSKEPEVLYEQIRDSKGRFTNRKRVKRIIVESIF